MGSVVRVGRQAVWAWLSLIIVAAPATGQELRLRPLTLENLFPRPGAGSVQLSPDGSRLAVSGSGPNGTAGTHIIDPRTGRPAGREAFIPGARSLVWSPDGGRMAFLRGDELRVRSTDGTGAVTLVSGMPGMRDPAWSPDGATIAFYSTESGDQDIWLARADGAAEPRQLTNATAEIDDARFAPSWSPDGRLIAFVSNRADWWHDDVWVIEVDEGEATRVSDGLMASSTPMWSPDGGRLALLGTAKDEYWYQDLAHLFVIRVVETEDGPEAATEMRLRMQVFGSDFIMRHDVFWSRDGAWIYFPYHERGAFDLWAVPAEGGVATRVTNRGGAWYSLTASGGAERFAFVRGAPGEGREAWVVEASGGPARRVTSLSPRLEGGQRPLEVSFRSFDGLYVQGFLYLPPVVRRALGAGVRTERTPAGLLDSSVYDGPSCPALVQVHGGGTNSFYQGENLVEQYLASRGFVVLAINYRGGSGFGRAFQDLGVEDWLNGQAKDPGAASDWLRAHPWVNGKVGIYGGSYGGMQSMAAITRTPDKFDAAVPMRGIYSEALTLEDADRLGTIFTITGHGGTPKERPEIYRKTNTLDRMDRITAPVLVMHGERDVRAPFRNFELAVERLESLGKIYEAKSYPEGHGFRDPANLRDMYGRLEGWMRRWLGDCTDP